MLRRIQRRPAEIGPSWVPAVAAWVKRSIFTMGIPSIRSDFVKIVHTYGLQFHPPPIKASYHIENFVKCSTPTFFSSCFAYCLFQLCSRERRVLVENIALMDRSKTHSHANLDTIAQRDLDIVSFVREAATVRKDHAITQHAHAAGTAQWVSTIPSRAWLAAIVQPIPKPPSNAPRVSTAL